MFSDSFKYSREQVGLSAEQSLVNLAHYKEVFVEWAASALKAAKLTKQSLVGDRTDYYRGRVKSKVLDAIDANFPKGAKQPPEFVTYQPEVILNKMRLFLVFSSTR